jgi:hypothetical protein
VVDEGLIIQKGLEVVKSTGGNTPLLKLVKDLVKEQQDLSPLSSNQ